MIKKVLSKKHMTIEREIPLERLDTGSQNSDEFVSLFVGIEDDREYVQVSDSFGKLCAVLLISMGIIFLIGFIWKSLDNLSGIIHSDCDPFSSQFQEASTKIYYGIEI